MFKSKNFVSSLLNVLGMTVAFAALYVILVQVHHDFSYNRRLKDHERIYIAALPSWYNDGKYMTHLNRPTVEGFVHETAGIEAYGTGAMQCFPTDVYLADGEDSEIFNRHMNSSMTEFSKGAMDVFGIEFIKGSFDDLVNSLHIAVEESEAERLGLDVGSVFMQKYSGSVKFRYEVRAIYKDMPENTLFDDFKMFVNLGDQSIDNYSEWSYQYYLKLSENISSEYLSDAFYEYIIEMVKEEYPGQDESVYEEAMKQYRMRFFPVADAYFDETLEYYGAKGNKITTLTLLAAAILVIVIAFINYVNFFMAMVPLRMRTVNTRKILGSSRLQIIWSYIMESLIMILTALVLAAVLVVLFKSSSLLDLIDCNVGFGSNAGVAAFTFILALLMSVGASIYPAMYITSFNPAMVIRGSFGASTGGKHLRNVLVGLQFAISIVLIVCSIFINLQRSYMLKQDMGFERENLLVSTVSWKIANNYADAVTNSLKSSPSVKDVTWANGDIVQPSRMGWGRDFKDQRINFQCYPVSWNFLKVMGIEVVEGRDFTQSDELSENGVFIFNEKARDDFGLTLEDRIVGHIDNSEIVGFCRNFNFQALQTGVEPLCLYVFGSRPWRKNNTLFVRTVEGADLGEVMDLMRSAIAEFDPEIPVDEVNVEIFDQQLAKSYYKEESLSKLITMFTVLAIIISLMGVFGMVMFETEYRQKEIGVRRVNGATVQEILTMFNVKFVRIVLICFVIAAPLSWFIMDNYLSGFAYRVPLYVWVFLVALLAVLAVTVSVVTLRSFKASTQNPVDALRSE